MTAPPTNTKSSNIGKAGPWSKPLGVARVTLACSSDGLIANFYIRDSRIANAKVEFTQGS